MVAGEWRRGVECGPGRTSGQAVSRGEAATVDERDRRHRRFPGGLEEEDLQGGRGRRDQQGGAADRQDGAGGAGGRLRVIDSEAWGHGHRRTEGRRELEKQERDSLLLPEKL